jgi:hypothetical protein
LEQLALRAYRKVDASLIPRIYTTDSPTAESVREELQQLTQDGVRAILTHKTESLEVTSHSLDEIELLQRVVVSGRIKGAGDTKVEGAWSRRQRRTIQTTLREDSGQWLIYRTVIVDVERLGR